MINIQSLRQTQPNIICIGSHHPIIQSMLDFDFLQGKKEPSVKAIIAAGRSFERYFFGNKEILIPIYSSIDAVPQKKKQEVNLFFNASSARRAKDTTIALFQQIPHLIGGTIFAEDMTEKHALELYQFLNAINSKHEIRNSKQIQNTNNQIAKQLSPLPKGEDKGEGYVSNFENSNLGFASDFDIRNSDFKFILGPSSVGLLIPGSVKLSAICGTDYRQLIAADVMTPGDIAILSASGGMVGEIINLVTQAGHHLSFALSFGGDRFPVLAPKDAFLAAEADPQTKKIIYYGELGGTDEYELVSLLETKQITKPVICYIAGTVAELFDTPPQFGHAKAIAKQSDESAREKRKALQKAGAHVPETFSQFVKLINDVPLPKGSDKIKYDTLRSVMDNRKHALITTTVSKDEDGEVKILNEDLLTFANNHSFAHNAISLFLGKPIRSKELERFVDLVLKLAMDHGPYVSGAVNTIVTARAGRDLVSSLSAGLLTIGPRFGGAINQAAGNWLSGVAENKSPHEFVEHFAAKRKYIAGIGHKKYRIDMPDPRVTELLKHTEYLDKKRFSHFALAVQKITTAKKGNLILNVDGTIAAILLDLLSEKEHLSDEELKKLVETEFFNALFVLSRSVGFIAHYLDQKRLDEGLFRLPDDLVTTADME